MHQRGLLFSHVWWGSEGRVFWAPGCQRVKHCCYLREQGMTQGAPCGASIGGGIRSVLLMLQWWCTALHSPLPPPRKWYCLFRSQVYNTIPPLLTPQSLLLLVITKVIMLYWSYSHSYCCETIMRWHPVLCQRRRSKRDLWFVYWKCSHVNKNTSLSSLFGVAHKSFDSVLHKCFVLLCQKADDWMRHLPIRENHKAGRFYCEDLCYSLSLRGGGKPLTRCTSETFLKKYQQADVGESGLLIRLYEGCFHTWYKGLILHIIISLKKQELLPL